MDFRDLKFLGQGAYGVVYKATRKADGKHYAAKCYNFRNYKDPKLGRAELKKIGAASTQDGDET